MYSGVRLSGRSHSPLSNYYAWEFPGAPARVHLRLDVVREIERQLQWQYQYDPETQLFGVLLGRAVPHGAIIVEDFERVEGGDNDERLKTVIAKWSAKADPNLAVVGYYRGQAKDGFALTNEDLILIRTQFALPLTVVMLIKPSSTSVATGGFFFALNGEAKSRFSFGRFPFDRDQLAAEKPPQVQTAEATPHLLAAAPSSTREKSPAPPKSLEQSIAEDIASMRPTTAPPLTLPQPVQTLIAPPKAQPRDRAWMWFASAAALAVLALGVELYQWTQSPETAVALEASRTASGGLQVNWNKKARVFNGDGALLSIQEGDYKKQIYLDLPKLRTGYLLYYPRTNSQVILRMEVLLRGGQRTAMVSTIVGEAKGGSGQPREPAGSPAPGDGSTPAASAVQPTPSSTSAGSGSAVVVLDPPDPGAIAEIPGAVQEIPVSSATHAVTLAGGPAPTSPERLASFSSSAPAFAAPSTDKDAPVVKLDAGNTPVEPRVVHSVMPVPPKDSKLWTGYPVLIDVLVQIDAQGKVISAVARNSKTASGALLSKLAVDAAQQWQFEPAYVGNQKVASEMLLRFRF